MSGKGRKRGRRRRRKRGQRPPKDAVPFNVRRATHEQEMRRRLLMWKWGTGGAVVLGLVFGLAFQIPRETLTSALALVTTLYIYMRFRTQRQLKAGPPRLPEPAPAAPSPPTTQASSSPEQEEDEASTTPELLDASVSPEGAPVPVPTKVRS